MKRAVISFVLCLSAISLAADFQGLGAGSIANDLSADGSVVVGSGRWTQNSGWQDIGGTANACSADGSVVVGYRQCFDYWGGGYKSLIFWTAADGSIELSNSSIENVIPTDISDDGMKISGYVTHGGSTNWRNPFYLEAFLYEIGTGRTMLGDLSGPQGGANPTDVRSVAYAISGDGTIVAGQGMPQNTNSRKAMYWTEMTGMVNMGCLTGDNFSKICGISQDGSKMIGQSGFLEWFFVKAVYWTQDTGMRSLGEIDGFTSESCALAISDDLSTIVGWATDGYGDYAAFLWKESLGMVNLQKYLQGTYGIGLEGWTLTEATGISADGLTIVGNGINPAGLEEAWRVTIPEPASLLLLSFGAYCIRKRKK